MGTSFVIEFLTREFLTVIQDKKEKMIKLVSENIKKDLDIEVQNTAKEIYDNLIKGVNIDLIPKCEDDNDEEEANEEKGGKDEENGK